MSVSRAPLRGSGLQSPAPSINKQIKGEEPAREERGKDGVGRRNEVSILSVHEQRRQGDGIKNPKSG